MKDAILFTATAIGLLYFGAIVYNILPCCAWDVAADACRRGASACASAYFATTVLGIMWSAGVTAITYGVPMAVVLTALGVLDD